MNPPDQSCGSCKFMQRIPQDMKVLLCRRFPPQIVVGPQGPLVLFPTMQTTGWCGEYQKKLELTS